MLSDTLVAGLRRCEIGSKLRALRVKKKLGLVQLGEHTGLSAALLSKIERGNLFPTLPRLLRIAMVFGVVGSFQSFHTARRTIRRFEAMLWLRKGFGFAGAWTVCEQNQMLSVCFGLPQAHKA